MDTGCYHLGRACGRATYKFIHLLSVRSTLSVVQIIPLVYPAINHFLLIQTGATCLSLICGAVLGVIPDLYHLYIN